MKKPSTETDKPVEAPSTDFHDDLFGDFDSDSMSQGRLAASSSTKPASSSASSPKSASESAPKPVSRPKSVLQPNANSTPRSTTVSGESHSLGRTLVPLMKGVVYKDADAQRWESMLVLQPRIQDHVAVLGLELVLDEAEGYAFLHTRAVEEDEEEMPRLTVKRALSFPVSLLIALLRKRLVEIDVAGGDTRLVLTRTEIVDLLRLFLPDTSNEAKLIDQVDTHIKKVIDLGFLRKMKVSSGAADKEERFEVKRIIRAFVDAQWLSEFDQRLTEYAAHIRGDMAEPDDDKAADATP